MLALLERRVLRSAPAFNRLTRFLIERTSDQAVLRHVDAVERPIGHRQVGGAAIESVDPRNVFVIPAKKRPRVDARGRVQCIDRPRAGALAIYVAEPSAN